MGIWSSANTLSSMALTGWRWLNTTNNSHNNNQPVVGIWSSANTLSSIALTSCLMVAAAVLMVVLSLVKCKRKHNTRAWKWNHSCPFALTHNFMYITSLCVCGGGGDKGIFMSVSSCIIISVLSGNIYIYLLFSPLHKNSAMQELWLGWWESRRRWECRVWLVG